MGLASVFGVPYLRALTLSRFISVHELASLLELQVVRQALGFGAHRDKRQCTVLCKYVCTHERTPLGEVSASGKQFELSDGETPPHGGGNGFTYRQWFTLVVWYLETESL